jgi:hypothetical protein
LLLDNQNGLVSAIITIRSKQGGILTEERSISGNGNKSEEDCDDVACTEAVCEESADQTEDRANSIRRNLLKSQSVNGEKK